MRTLLLCIVAVLAMAIYSCTDEYTKNCKDFLKDEFKHGYCFAKGSYKDFGEFAHFGFNKNIDNDSIIGLTLMNLDADCIIKEYIAFYNIPIKLNDTIYIKSFLDSENYLPSAVFRIKDGFDAIIETYGILEDSTKLNWILINSINSEKTILTGKFQLSFVTTYIPYLTGERERWDDPNRPDTLYFTNGEFKAVLSSN